MSRLIDVACQALAGFFFVPPLRPHRRRARKRFLLPEEWSRIRAVLAHCPQKVQTYFTLMVLEAPRRSELRLMQWAHIDLHDGFWYLPETKNGEEQFVALSPQVCTLLNGLARSSRFVFVGKTPEQPWSCTAIEYWWRKIRRLAQCEDVQIRDLRRTCASWMIMHGENTKVVQEVLRHRFLQTTQIYARLDQTAIRTALTRHAERVLNA